MSTITTYPHIVKEPGLPARSESHPRVAIIVMDYLGRGLGPRTLCRRPF